MFRKCSRTATVLVFAGIVAGCAAAPPQQARLGDPASLAGDNLDLLFATEFPVTSKEEAIGKSNLAYREGDVEKALFYSVKALTFDPADIDVLVRIAQLHVLQGNARMAARSFNFALAEDPDHAESLQGLGLLYFEAGDEDKARQKLEAAVAQDENLWRSHNILGVLADGRKDYRLAADYYGKALAIRPDSVSARINRGYSSYLAGDLAAAAKQLYEVAKDSNHPKAWRNLGVVYANLGWYDEALAVFRKVDDEAKAYNRTGEIALSNNDLSVAREYLSEAVRQSPVYFAEAEQNLARLERRQRN